MHDVFISHASEDKETVAIPLANKLREFGVNAWLDKFELKAGDSLQNKINSGLSESRFGIVILSEAFFQKLWTRRELEVLESQEKDGHTRIIPIWHNIGEDKIRFYSEALADRLGISTDKGLQFVVAEVLKCLLSKQIVKNEQFVKTLEKLKSETVALLERIRTQESLTLPESRWFKARQDTDFDEILGHFQHVIDALLVFFDNEFIEQLYESKAKLIEDTVNMAAKQNNDTPDNSFDRKHRIFLLTFSPYFNKKVKQECESRLADLVDRLSSLY